MRKFWGLLLLGWLGCWPAVAQSVNPARGVDPRVDYKALGQFGPWDDRNYQLTSEDLQLLAPDEAQQADPIPAFFRVLLRRNWPTLRRSGSAQYPRSALQIFQQMYGGYLRDGKLVRAVEEGEEAEREREADEPASISPSETKMTTPVGAAESAIAIHPTDPNLIIAGVNSAVPQQDMYRSTNGGQTWTKTQSLSGSCCDPTVGWSSDGTIAYTATLKSCGFSGCGVSAYRSTNGGQSWTGEAVLTSSGSDKEFLHVDTYPTSPYKENVYLTWHDNNVLQFARSTNQGVSYSTPLSFSSAPQGIGSDITTDKGGNVYYIYPSFDAGSQAIWLLKSTNGGASFAAPIEIAPTNGNFDWPIPAMETRRAWIYVAADADLSDGPYANSLYAAWTDTTGPESGTAGQNHTHIVVARSRDAGQTWQTSIAHEVADANSVDRFNQWMEVDEVGNVHVIFYDTRNNAARTSVDLYYTYSTDGGVTFIAPQRVTGVTSANIADGFEWGDYNGLSILLAKVIAIYTDNRVEGGGTGDSVDVYSASFLNEVATADFSLGLAPAELGVCTTAASADFTVSLGSLLNFAEPVTLNITGHPSGSTVQLSVNPVTPPGASVLTLGAIPGVAAGDYSIAAQGMASPSGKTHSGNALLHVYDAAPAAATLTTPADGAANVAPAVNFAWSAAAQAKSYRLEVATDAGFTSLVVDAPNLAQPAYTTDLSTGVQYYWRVTASNDCGTGSTSAVSSFSTQTGPGDCSIGVVPQVLLQDDLEGGVGVWTHSGTLDTWALNGSFPHSGASAWNTTDPGSVGDQRLVSPPVSIAADSVLPTLRFYHRQSFESNSGGCYDGGILEVSTNGGASFAQVPNSALLADPYDGAVSNSSGNPLAGLQAWCGDPQPYTEARVDLSPYIGQTVLFRFRLGSDSSVSRTEGWSIDDLKVQQCAGGSSTPTATPSPSRTPTRTPTGAAPTPSPSTTPTATSTETPPPPPSETPTPAATSTETPSPPPSATPPATSTETPTLPPPATSTETPTSTPSVTSTATPSPTPPAPSLDGPAGGWVFVLGLAVLAILPAALRRSFLGRRGVWTLLLICASAGWAQELDAWKSLKPGDWALFRTRTSPSLETRMKWTVRSADAEKVVYHVETVTLLEGKPVAAPLSEELTYDFVSPAAVPDATPKTIQETSEAGVVHVRDRDLKVKVLIREVTAAGQKSVAKTYASEEVPFGIVKIESNGVLSQELIDWGRGP